MRRTRRGDPSAAPSMPVRRIGKHKDGNDQQGQELHMHRISLLLASSLRRCPHPASYLLLHEQPVYASLQKGAE